MVTDDRSRGQVILIGAITLAFIILGIVVVFNGVLYTETLSSGSSGQSATDATVTELEIERGVGCLLDQVDSDIRSQNTSVDWETHVRENISNFSNSYRESKSKSSPVVVNVSVDSVENGSTGLESATVIITYDSNDISYERNQMIPAECPPGGP